MLDKLNHMDGKDLLRDAHLMDFQGWKLPPRLIPHREFFSSETRPELITTLENPMDGWDTWYSWRKLSKESPAALLMNHPLSAFWMLTHCLNLTSPGAGLPSKRVPLHIHLIGAEVELNYIPLFSELALLLPYHDLKLVFFGQSVHGLVQKAKQSHPKSLAGRSSPTTPVYTYKAPEECGSGTVEIFLHGSDQIWDPHFRLDSSYGSPPDGLIAFNAGLISYAEWIPVIRGSHIASLPFAVTEYTEHSAELQRSELPKFLGGLSRRQSAYQIEMNPFQRPGDWRLPSLLQICRI